MLLYDGTRMKASDTLWLKVDINMQVRRRIRSPKLLDGCGAYRFFAYTHILRAPLPNFPRLQGSAIDKKIGSLAEKNPRE
jgi:hypothetical protein